MRIPEGGWKPIYRVDQRWVKNNRDPENTTYALSFLSMFRIVSSGWLNIPLVSSGPEELTRLGCCYRAD